MMFCLMTLCVGRPRGMRRESIKYIKNLALCMSKKRIPREQQQKIALEQVKTFLQEAEEAFSEDKAWANRLVGKARRAAMKVKLKMPRELKRKYCKHCYAFLMPGVNARVRTARGKVVISCFDCKKFMRIPIGRKK